MKNQHIDKARFTQRHNDAAPKIITSPGNQYDLPQTRGDNADTIPNYVVSPMMIAHDKGSPRKSMKLKP